MRFKITQYITDYINVDGEYKNVEVQNKYECGNFDDLQDLIMTIVDHSSKDVKFNIKKEEDEIDG